MPNATYTYTIEKCRYCGQSHSYILNVEKEVPVFGGAVENGAGNGEKEWGFTCPSSHKIFSQEVKLPKGFKMLGVAGVADTPVPGNGEIPATQPTAEYQAWINESRARAVTFCTTMLTTSTGAIGVFFAIEKYLGNEKLSSNTIGIMAVLPPVLYLLAAVLFVLALRPKFSSVAASDFEHFRNERLKALNKFLSYGLLTFLTATLIAVVHFSMLLR